MLKLLSRQAIKAFRDPSRGPLPNPLHTRHLHDALVPPFSGPPNYATIARRFSASNPNPVSFFRQKVVKEAIEQGRFVDIHDVGGVDPKDYDVLLSDMDDNTLHSEISKLVGIPYLDKVMKDEADKVAEEIHGFLYGPKSRLILPCVLSIEDKARWVFFIVDSTAPLTYISTQVAQAFSLDVNEEHWNNVKVAGYSQPVYLSPPNSHFSEVNLLGIDFCSANRLRTWIDDSPRLVTYYIGKNCWEKPKSSSTYYDASFDLKLNNLRSEMKDLNYTTIIAVDDKIKNLGDKLSMEIKSLSTVMDARFAAMDARFEISETKIQSKFDTLRIELRDREARFGLE